MPWVRLDDAFHAHPKLAALGTRTLPAVGLYVLGLTWSSAYLTDGVVPKGQLHKLGGTPALAAALVDAGLWERTDVGYRIHDYLEYNPSRERVQAGRATDADRKRRGRTSILRPAGHEPGLRSESARPVPIPVPVARSSESDDSSERAGARTGRAIGPNDGLPHLDPDTAAVGEAITGRGVLAAGEKQLTELDRLIEAHGAEAVQAAMRRLANGGRLEWRQLVWGIVKDLEPIPGARRETAEEREDREVAELKALAAHRIAERREAARA
jgi:hypothetical protein